MSVQEVVELFSHNLFKPILLFFYAGFLIPILRVQFEFPKQVYQGLTIFLLLGIGWHGGEELAHLKQAELIQAIGFMAIGFFTNLSIGFIAYLSLRTFTRLRKIDCATVAGYYGSDSAGTFVTAVGVLTAASVAYAAYMPVMLAVMEIPGCLVALFLATRLREQGLIEEQAQTPKVARQGHGSHVEDFDEVITQETEEEELVGAGASREGRAIHSRRRFSATRVTTHSGNGSHGGDEEHSPSEGEKLEARMALQPEPSHATPKRKGFLGFLTTDLLHEVFLNPGIFLLFAGVTIGLLSGAQGEAVTKAPDALFNTLFQGLLCLFLLEMGMTASARLKDLRAAGWQFVTFALVAPNVFAILGMLVAYVYSLYLGQQFEPGTYLLFGVLCGSASYIALPAVQRMGIPEASPTLPLAASLGVTFTYNVTIGIPFYLMIAKAISGHVVGG